MAKSCLKNKNKQTTFGLYLHIQLLSLFNFFLIFLFFFQKEKQNEEVIAHGTLVFLRRGLLENKLSRHLRELYNLTP